ncbi:MAG: GTPase Era [Dehalococcoidia bacterium]|nr:GTPase Era [Dehalococcoidia bacterium]
MQSQPETHSAPPFHCGTVSIAGRPNVGKSTLMNILIDFKLSAVSPKPKTTRHKILGVLTDEDYQVAFLDTPGLPSRRHDELDRRLLSSSLEAIHEADLVVMVVEPKPPGEIEHRLIGELRGESKQAILAINKIDLVKKPELLPVMEAYARLYPFLEIVPISAVQPDGVDTLLNLIVRHLPEGEPLFAPDDVTDRPERFLAAELIREQVFNSYAQEVPYAVAVEIDTFQEQSQEHGGKDYISAILYVERDSQKAILIGRGGAMLKEIGTQARQGIEALLERPVHLELWVKVYPDWQMDRAFLLRLGY